MLQRGALEILPIEVILGLLCGCAVSPPVPAAVRTAEPDCSFRAATSCWTLGPRFPARPLEPSDSGPGKILAPPSAVLASVPDSGQANPLPQR
jgi:hypothetical protein